MLKKILKINGHIKGGEEDEQLSELDRIKLARAAKRVYMSIHSCIIHCFFSAIIDLPLIPLALAASVLMPWRLRLFYRLVIQPDDRLPTRFSFKKMIASRRFLAIVTIVGVLVGDVLALVCVVVLLGTVWRAGRTWTLLITYAKKIWRGELEEGSFVLNKKIYGMAFYLLLDVLQVLQIVVVACLILHAKSLYTRLMRIRAIETRRQRVFRVQQKKDGGAKDAPKLEKNLMGLTPNILATMLTFCDATDVLRFEMTCRKAYEVTTIPRVWNNLYDKVYAKYAPIPPGTEEPDYKRHCIEGYKKRQEEAQQAEQPVVSEEVRDLVLGPRFIVCEEFLYSLMRAPHLLCAPIKVVALVVYPLREKVASLCQNAIHDPQFHAYTTLQILREPAPTAQTMFHEEDQLEYKDWWRLQDTLLMTVIHLFSQIGHVVTYYTCSLAFWLMKVTTGNATVQITVQPNYNMYPYPTNVPPFLNERFYYVMQVITGPIFLALHLMPFGLPVWVWYRYCGLSFLESLVGPYLVNVFFYGTGIQIIITTGDLTRFCPYYNPFYGILKDVMIAIYLAGCKVAGAVRKSLSAVVRVIYNAFSFLFEYLVRTPSSPLS